MFLLASFVSMVIPIRSVVGSSYRSAMPSASSQHTSFPRKILALDRINKRTRPFCAASAARTMTSSVVIPTMEAKHKVVPREFLVIRRACAPYSRLNVRLAHSPLAVRYWLLCLVASCQSTRPVLDAQPFACSVFAFQNDCTSQAGVGSVSALHISRSDHLTMLRLSDCICHDSATCAEGLVSRNGRIANGLVLDLGIELRAK